MCTFHFNVSHFDGICHSLGVIMRTQHTRNTYPSIHSSPICDFFPFLIQPYWSIFIYQSICLPICFAHSNTTHTHTQIHSLTLILLALSTLYRSDRVEVSLRVFVYHQHPNIDKSNWFSCVLTTSTLCPMNDHFSGFCSLSFMIPYLRTKSIVA